MGGVAGEPPAPLSGTVKLTPLPACEEGMPFRGGDVASGGKRLSFPHSWPKATTSCSNNEPRRVRLPKTYTAAGLVAGSAEFLGPYEETGWVS